MTVDLRWPTPQAGLEKQSWECFLYFAVVVLALTLRISMSASAQSGVVVNTLLPTGRYQDTIFDINTRNYAFYLTQSYIGK